MPMTNELLKVFFSGGYVMFPLLICSLISVTIIIERLINLREPRIIRTEEIKKINELIEKRYYDKALELCIANPNPVNNIVKVIIENRGMSADALRQSVMDSAQLELSSIEKYLAALSTMVSASPLLGLLGTVTGMMKVFHVVTTIGLGEPSALAGGIAEALITTVYGLSIAIPSLIMHNLFQRKAEIIIGKIEAFSLGMIRKVTPAESSGS
jgi:biopolymer transport protein ExbB